MVACWLGQEGMAQGLCCLLERQRKHYQRSINEAVGRWHAGVLACWRAVLRSASLLLLSLPPCLHSSKASFTAMTTRSRRALAQAQAKAMTRATMTGSKASGSHGHNSAHNALQVGCHQQQRAMAEEARGAAGGTADSRCRCLKFRHNNQPLTSPNPSPPSNLTRLRLPSRSSQARQATQNTPADALMPFTPEDEHHYENGAGCHRPTCGRPELDPGTGSGLLH